MRISEIVILVLFISIILVELALMIGLGLYTVMVILIRKFREKKTKNKDKIFAQEIKGKKFCLKNIFMVFEEKNSEKRKGVFSVRNDFQENKIEILSVDKIENEMRNENEGSNRKISQIKNPLESKRKTINEQKFKNFMRKKVENSKIIMRGEKEERKFKISKQKMKYSSTSKGKKRG